jgi:D-serine deaminase-like pyridoxal phosphate-dependent protein
MDAGYNALNLAFKNALFVHSTIISVTEDWVMADAGLKTLSVDQDRPWLVEAPNAVFRISEEHCPIPREQFDAQIGDRVNFVPSHCCTTMNLHDYVYFVRNSKVIDKVIITGRGKSL